MKIIHSQSNSPTFNLAAEEFLFSERQDDVLFLYVNEPSVIIGSNQAIRNEVDLAFCAENNIQIVRRMSGGGAVYHDLGNLNYCFISNKIQGQSSLSTDFLLPIVNVLETMNIPLEIGKRKDLWLPGGYKISGTASHISKNRELHHGTLLYNTDLDKLKKSLFVRSKNIEIKAIPSVPSTVKNIRTFLEEQNYDAYSAIDFFQLVIEKLRYLFDLENISSFSEKEKAEINSLETKYQSLTWTFKK